MLKSIAFLATILVPTIVLFAGDLSADEKEFFAKHSTELVKIEPTKLEDPILLKVFSAPIFNVKIILSQPGGDVDLASIAARIDDQLLNISRPTTDCKLPGFEKLFKTDFRLATDDDAKTLQQVLDALYPVITDDDKKALAIKHEGNKWTLIRGVFFDSKMGYIFHTSADGKITSAEFMLKLP